MGYCFITVVLQWAAASLQQCCSGAAASLQQCCSGAAASLQQCCSGAAASLQQRCSGAAASLQQCCCFITAVLQWAAASLQQWCCCFITAVLQWCCCFIAAVLQWCCCFIAAVLQWCCCFIAAVLQWCCCFITAVLQWCCCFITAVLQWAAASLQQCCSGLLLHYSSAAVGYCFTVYQLMQRLTHSTLNTNKYEMYIQCITEACSDLWIPDFFSDGHTIYSNCATLFVVVVIVRSLHTEIVQLYYGYFENTRIRFIVVDFNHHT